MHRDKDDSNDKSTKIDEMTLVIAKIRTMQVDKQTVSKSVMGDKEHSSKGKTRECKRETRRCIC